MPLNFLRGFHSNLLCEIFLEKRIWVSNQINRLGVADESMIECLFDLKRLKL
jgi:hypothetical protein